jgi:hypothetical protein
MNIVCTQNDTSRLVGRSLYSEQRSRMNKSFELHQDQISFCS